ncbi:putative DNA binding domain-containing protein [Arcanobacterium hippocoleae]
MYNAFMTPRTIDSALEASIETRTKILLTHKENQWFDRKSIRIEPKKLAQTLIALANAEGGIVVVGINSGNIESVEENPDLANRVRRILTAEYLEMPFPASVQELAVLNTKNTIVHILIFQIQPSEKLCKTPSGQVFVRKGDSNITQTPAEIRELEYTRGISLFEAEPCSIPCTSLNTEYIKRFAKKVGSTRDFRHLLTSRGLLKQSGEVTNAACLLFADSPVLTIPGSEIRVVRYAGKKEKLANGKILPSIAAQTCRFRKLSIRLFNG